MVNVEDLSALMELDYRQYDIMEGFMLFRVSSQHFAYCFNVLHGTDEDRREMAQLRFRRYGEQETDMTHIFLHISNHVLYDRDLLDRVLVLPEKLGMVFHNITTIDLAKDFTKINPVTIIRKMYKDKDITSIINGKAIKDRKQTIIGFSQTYSISLDRLKNPTISIKQAKAVHNKTKGITVCAYNKVAEITESEKNYILDYYGCPKKLHRLEVHQNNNEIKDYCKTHNITQTINLIFNQQFLDNMYYTHLASILRFTRGRTPLKWHEILHPQVMITTIPTNAKEAG